MNRISVPGVIHRNRDLQTPTAYSVATSRIKVLIRARPLSKVEKGRGAKNVLDRQSEQQITVWDPACYDLASRAEINEIDPACWSRSFTFDKTLWSVDRSEPDYASQDVVYETVGAPVLELVLDGFNCCVFAFGQTGSGKTLTMIGENVSGGNPEGYGLIPRICFELFSALENNAANDGYVETVDFSHLEIYNESIKDLLAPPQQGYLKVREHPQKGIFVSGLTVVRVTKFEDVMSLIAVGDKNRSVAVTNINAHSSRSHAICTITVCQRTRNAQKKNDLPTSALQQKVARLHLVDLAGSERVALSGATGTRLKEAGNINKSLSVLGDVIKSLGDSRTQKTHIPYRNSTLTMILKDSLGGNSHVFMLATISPSSSDYEETVSTLKFAERAKRVRLRVEANVTSGLLASDQSAVELVPLLQAEVAKLRQLLQKQQEESSAKKSVLEKEGQTQVMLEMKMRVRDLEQQLEERELLIRSLEPKNDDEVDMITADENDFHTEMTTGYAQMQNFPTKDGKLSSGSGGSESSDFNTNAMKPNSLVRSPIHGAQSVISSAVNRSTGASPLRNTLQAVLSEDAHDTTLPRVINLNQDPLFSECLVYYIPEGNVLAGNSEDYADILLAGPDIYPRHCLFKHKENGEIVIEPIESAQVFVNGQLVKKRSDTLKSCDRIALGRFHLFRFEAKSEKRANGGAVVKRANSDEEVIIPDWEFAQTELMTRSGSFISPKFSSSKNVPTHFPSPPQGDASLLDAEEQSPSPSPPPPMLEPGEENLKSIIRMESLGSGSGDSDDLWDKINQVVSNDNASSDPEELQEMMRMVVEKAEYHYNSKKNRENNVNDSIGSSNSISNSSNKSAKKVTFDLTEQPDKKFAPYISLQQRAAAGSVAAKEPKSVLRQNKGNMPLIYSHDVNESKITSSSDKSLSSSLEVQSQLQSHQKVIQESMQPSASVLNGGFEEEAKALQDELSKMQQQLSQRMARYNQLNEFNFSSQADSAIPSSTN